VRALVYAELASRYPEPEASTLIWRAPSPGAAFVFAWSRMT